MIPAKIAITELRAKMGQLSTRDCCTTRMVPICSTITGFLSSTIPGTLIIGKNFPPSPSNVGAPSTLATGNAKSELWSLLSRNSGCWNSSHVSHASSTSSRKIFHDWSNSECISLTLKELWHLQVSETKLRRIYVIGINLGVSSVTSSTSLATMKLLRKASEKHKRRDDSQNNTVRELMPLNQSEAKS